MSLAGHTDASVQSPDVCVSICLVSSLLVLASLAWLRDCHSPSRAEIHWFPVSECVDIKASSGFKEKGFWATYKVFFYVH